MLVTKQKSTFNSHITNIITNIISLDIAVIIFVLQTLTSPKYETSLTNLNENLVL